MREEKGRAKKKQHSGPKLVTKEAWNSGTSALWGVSYQKKDFQGKPKGGGGGRARKKGGGKGQHQRKNHNGFSIGEFLREEPTIRKKKKKGIRTKKKQIRTNGKPQKRSPSMAIGGKKQHQQ